MSIGDNLVIINISAEINKSLELNTNASDLIDKINKLEDDDIIIDFSNVYFISRTFAQAYYASKKRSSKKITEINLSDDVKPMMEMIEKQLMH
jgi:anti-anti-sigma regulatory factor